jgi:uncharacterized hydrophobic protein (TIGR00341 family)
MSLRLIEVTVAKDQLDRASAILSDPRVLDSWCTEHTDGSSTVRALVDISHAEPVSDLFVDQVGSSDGFRLLLLSLEATLPTVEQAPKEAPPSAPGEAPGPKAPTRISRDELYEDIGRANRVTSTYVLMVALSSVVAAVGLLRGDVAVVIGAMVIAPLLGPNIALALACTLGDLDLAKRSLRSNAIGVVTAASIALALGALLTVDPAAPEIARRTSAGMGDIALALAAGAAGSLAFTSGVPAIVVGVMVAVALLPPLVVAGLLAGSGHMALAGGALTLVLTNVTCINLAAVVAFLVQRVGPRTWWEADRARKATRIAIALWALMLAVLVGLIASGRVSG